ncbi:MAG TPA: TIGR03668 family PPOX class F420-dependent oxidoreductase [Actinoplanes sp.]
MDNHDAERFAAARVARLATVGSDGAPHLVPITFALVGDVIYSAVDAKPKRHSRLRRLANVAYEPRVSVLVDRYDDDWTALWWVRADGVARVLALSPAALEALTTKYPQYRADPPPGPFLEIEVRRWSAWSATPATETDVAGPSDPRGWSA